MRQVLLTAAIMMAVISFFLMVLGFIQLVSNVPIILEYHRPEYDPRLKTPRAEGVYFVSQNHKLNLSQKVCANSLEGS